jgi:hypothetical protein
MASGQNWATTQCRHQQVLRVVIPIEWVSGLTLGARIARIYSAQLPTRSGHELPH